MLEKIKDDVLGLLANDEQELINALNAKLQEIIELDGFQEMADGFSQAMEVVRDTFAKRRERVENEFKPDREI